MPLVLKGMVSVSESVNIQSALLEPLSATNNIFKFPEEFDL